MSLTTASPATVARPTSHRRGNPWWTLACVALGVIMVGIDGSVVAIANPYIARSLHASLADLQWVTNAYLLALAVLLVAGGKLGDRYGRRLVYLIGVAGFAACSVGVGLVGSITGVIVLRTLQGAFGALLMPNTLALLRSAFPQEKLNQAVGIWGGTSALATAAGPIVGGLLVEHVSWESVFYINAPIAAITVVIGLVVLAESRETVRQVLDGLGLILLAGSLFCLVFGVVEGQTWGWGAPSIDGLLAGGAVLLVAFGLVEAKVHAPLIPLRVIAQRSVALGTVTVLLTFFAMYGVLFFVSLYLQNVHGLDPVGAGVRTLPLTLVFAVSSPLGAWLTGRFGPRVPIALGLGVTGVALLLLLSLEPGSSYVHLWPSFVLLGIGIGLVVVASTDAIVANAPADEAGIAGGIQTTALQFGGVLGTAVLGSVIATVVGSRLVGDLTHAGLPHGVAAKFQVAKELVAQGVAPVPKGAPAALAKVVTTGSHQAFMSGLHEALLVAAVVSFLGAIAGLFVSRGEHREGALPVIG
ncbi:MFS transporter [Aciditerrimonas ferrireducens]|uniref:MFS transporter n=1 Tax=Aciditerrimonas ferrireducens TaxID=667306 RepID=UPI0020040102|nr:MFS transporter [Aciditerrimonas ferrireducens]MCK4176645.1 MFS transporter [Aciditerrimonas ferrireducens]